MQSKASELDLRFNRLYNDLLLKLARNRIFLINEQQISTEQSEWVKKYFKKKVLTTPNAILVERRKSIAQHSKR